MPHICPGSPPSGLTLIGALYLNLVWAISRFRERLGRCRVELHNRTLLGTLSLLLLVITKLQGKLGESSSLKTLPQCTSPQHGPRLRAALKWPISRLNTVHLYRRLVLEACSSLSRAYCSYKLPRACCNIPLLQERSSLYFLLVLVFYECFKL